MKAQIISLDLMVALPIASIGILLLLASARSSQSYLLDVAEYQNRSMGLFATSQQIAAAIDFPNTNLSAAASVSNGIAAAHGFRAAIADSSTDISACASSLVSCRFVTLSGSTYLLVVYHESPS